LRDGSRDGEVDTLSGLIRRTVSPQIDRSYSFLELSEFSISPTILSLAVVRVI
jgi:hypothetical protein